MVGSRGFSEEASLQSDQAECERAVQAASISGNPLPVAGSPQVPPGGRGNQTVVGDDPGIIETEAVVDDTGVGSYGECQQPAGGCKREKPVGRLQRPTRQSPA